MIAGGMIRTLTATEFPPERVLADKAGRTVSVVLPARNEEETVGKVAAVIRRDLMERWPVVDELVVVDDGSTDGTAEVAAAAGAEVVRAEAGSGKGQAMGRGLHVTGGDLVAFCDADVTGFQAGFVLGIVGPLLAHHDVEFVKGFYRRPYRGQPDEGGRVTELVARPLVGLLFPHLAPILQPWPASAPAGAGCCRPCRSRTATAWTSGC